MISLSVLFEFSLLIIYFISFRLATDNKDISNKNEINILNLSINNNTLYPVDASDLLECSKVNGYILLDKTKELTSQEFKLRDKLIPLESIYLSPQFFEIIESISGTRGNFVNDAISGIQITSIIDVLKDTKVEIYIGTINKEAKLENKKLNINLSCSYTNYYPTLTNYYYNNFCEYLNNDLENKYMLIEEEKTCFNKYFDNSGDNIYFNVLASLKIPILNYKDAKNYLFPSLNQNDFNLNSEFNFDRYLLLSRELGISFTINFGVTSFGKVNTKEKYYMLMKIVPPKSFWEKDNYYITNQGRIDSNTSNKKTSFECNKYESGDKLSGESSNICYLTEKSDGVLALKNNSISYIMLLPKNTYFCLNGYKLVFDIKNDNSTFIRIYDDELGFVDLMNENKSNSGVIKYYYLIKKTMMDGEIIIIAVNNSNKTVNLNYNLVCNNYKNHVKYLLSSISHSFARKKENIFLDKINAVNINNDEESYLNNKFKINEYKTRKLIMVIIIMIITISLLAIIFLNNKRDNRNYKIRNILNINLTKMSNKRVKESSNCYTSENQFNYNNENNYSYKLITENNNEQSFHTISLNSVSPATYKSIPDVQEYSPSQVDLYTAISNNMYDNAHFNTDYSSSPSTIKSITFKN